MGSITYRDGIAILSLVVYFPYLFAAAYVCLKHGFKKSSGWIYLVIFCLIRIVGSAAQLATISDKTSTTPYTIAAVTDSIGLSPLLFSSLGLLHRAYESSMKPSKAALFTIFRVPQLMLTVGLILGIIAATSANSPADIKKESTLRIAIILFTVGWIILSILTVAACVKYRRTGDGERKLLLAVACSLPIIFVRIVYSIIAVFGHWPRFNAVTGSVTIKLVMATLEEYLVISIYTVTGLLVMGISLQQQPFDPASDGPGYRGGGSGGRGEARGRGGWGSVIGQRRGLVGMAFTAANEAFSKTENEGHGDGRPQQRSGGQDVSI